MEISGNIARKLFTRFSFLFCLLLLSSCPQTNILAKFLVDGIPPRILSISPVNGEIIVPQETIITVTFSEPMDQSSMQRAFSLNPGKLAGTLTWSPDDKTITFSPTNKLQKMSTYTIEITTEAIDNNNINIEKPFTSTFTTRTTVGIAAGLNHTLVSKIDGTVYNWGENERKQLGDNSTIDSVIPVKVSGVSNVIDISTGMRGSHNIVLQADHTIRLWGENGYYQMGIGTPLGAQPEGLPVMVVDTNGVVGSIISIAAATNHTIALNSTGQIISWGYNNRGQLGTGDTTDQANPKLVTSVSNFASVYCGHSTSAAISNDEKAWLWGLNLNGQLGQDHNLYSWLTDPTELSLPGPVKKISCSSDFTVALVAEGESWNVYTWGSNTNGELGRTAPSPTFTPGKVTLPSSITKIAAGYHHVLALATDGKVYGWGLNDQGQLGAIASGSTPGFIIDNVEEIAAGAAHSVALKKDGTVWTWGSNASLQLGRTNTGVLIDSVPGFNVNN